MQGHNWKTMLFGALTILVSAGGAYAALHNNQPVDWTTVIATCLVGLGLITHHTPDNQAAPTDLDFSQKLAAISPIIQQALGPTKTAGVIAQAADIASNIISHPDGSISMPSTSVLGKDGVITHADGTKTILASAMPSPSPSSVLPLPGPSQS